MYEIIPLTLAMWGSVKAEFLRRVLQIEKAPRAVQLREHHSSRWRLADIKQKKDDVRYVLVFKLSRFARNAADTLENLRAMQNCGVDLLCTEDGMDSSSTSGKLIISIMSAFAEMELENIHTQTMAGRRQKA